jgi:putative FmdB family regulatory protein
MMYNYRCADCGCIITLIRRIKQRDDATLCPNCGAGMDRKITLPTHRPVISGGTGAGKFSR